MCKITTFLTVLFFSLTINSQTIKGTTTDTSGNPLPGVNIVIKGTKVGTQSDINGNYNLKLATKGFYSITSSFIGFKTTTKTIRLKANETKVVNFKLNETAQALDNIVITGKTNAQVVREQSYAVEAISTKELKNLSTDANAILAKVSGINIRESGGLGSDFNVSLNGFYGNQVRTFINGIPMHYFGNSLSLNNFPSNLIEQIEIYKGVVPIHLSSDVLGGAVNIITNTTQNQFLDVSYSIGSFNTHRFALNSKYRNDKNGFTARLKSFYNYADNNYKIPVFLTDPVTFQTSDTPTEVERFHDAYESQMIWPEIGFTKTKFADELMLGVLFSRNYKEIQQGNFIIGNSPTPFGEVHRKESNIITNFSFKKKNIASINNLNVNAYFVGVFSSFFNNDFGNYKYDWLGNKTKISDTSYAEQERKTKLNLNKTNYIGLFGTEYAINPNNNIAFNYNFNFYKISGTDEFKAENETQFKYPSLLNKQVFSASFTNSMFNKKLKTSIFGKYFLYNLETIETDFLGLKEDKVNANFNHLGYGATLSYQLGKFQIKTSFEDTTRFPEAEELFGNGTGIRQNVNLKPEKSNNYNLGFLFDNVGYKHKFIASVNTFLRKGENYIFPRPEAIWIKYKNTKNTLTKGIDLATSYGYNNTLFFTLNGTYYEKINTNKNDLTFEQRFPNEPYLLGNMSISYKKEHIFNGVLVTSLKQNYVHKFFTGWANLGAVEKDFVDTQYTNDLEFVYSKKNQKYNISFAVINLWDKEVFDNYKQSKPGRSFNLKLRIFIK